MKTYHELIAIPSFEERLKFLSIAQSVADPAWGSHRYLNQNLYRSPRWKSTRRQVIIRDNACDLAHEDYSLGDGVAYIHHINPVTIDDILEERSCVFDLENLITCSFQTHQAIHYGSTEPFTRVPTERRPNDTCPWK